MYAVLLGGIIGMATRAHVSSYTCIYACLFAHLGRDYRLQTLEGCRRPPWLALLASQPLGGDECPHLAVEDSVLDHPLQLVL